MTVSVKNALHFSCGASMKNRFMLAPMTNSQSHENGQLSDEEYNWLVKRAEGGFGMVMTCASHVQPIGKGFPGQLGIFSDVLMDGHKRLASGIRKHGSLAIIQLHHAGLRAPKALLNEAPVSASANEKHEARALSLSEVQQLRDDFIAAAVRSQKCGYDGVEVHGAHGYIVAQFLSKKFNQRTDEYGGSLDNRARLLFEIVDGIRNACGSRFVLGVRLSPERFGMELSEVKAICNRLVNENQIDFLDISLWDVFKQPEEEEHQGQSLLEHITNIDYGNVKLTVAGKIMTGQDIEKVLRAGVDFVGIGRAGILHHNFPTLVMENHHFTPISTPVSAAYLKQEALGEKFITYMNRWPGFVEA